MYLKGSFSALSFQVLQNQESTGAHVQRFLVDFFGFLSVKIRAQGNQTCTTKIVGEFDH